MEYILNSYEPKAIFHYFEDISRIPRGSGNEGAIAEFICEFARARGLRYYKDEFFNVAVYKDATEGMEDLAPVMLQGHTDMVCEKNADTKHDFLVDPIKLVEKDGWLMADGTTLGGDDGVAVAIMLGILDSKDIPHPALECLFTSQEESGLGGAENFDYSKLTAKKIINMDTELEGEAIASCAGSMNTLFKLAPEYHAFDGKALRISVKGLAGGHSGTDIDSGRLNSNIVMGRILAALYEEKEFNLVSISGGNKRNAIPRECDAVISVRDREKATEVILKLEADIRRELNFADREFRVLVSKTGAKERMMSFKDTSRVISFLGLVPNGVISMSQSKKGLVETSSNLGVITFEDETGEIKFFVYTRSSVEPSMDSVYIRLKRLGKALSMDFEKIDRCPGWAFNADSDLQKLFLKAYREEFGEKDGFPRVEAIHAGLECGIIIEKMGGGDAIAIGPTLHDIHTPKERLDLHSMERTWRLVVKMLGMRE